MKTKFFALFTGLALMSTSVFADLPELNLSYDYFRGLPDGSWNGNQGLLLSLNGGHRFFEKLDLQIGGSYGNYNWDGRQNLVFENSKSVQQIGIVTAGFSYHYHQLNVGIVYDYMFTRHFGIYNTNPGFDQIRFQGGYEICLDEFGFWGTTYLTTSHKRALGVPLSFRAIDQINIFWTHRFSNCAKTTLWIGKPYSNSLIHTHKEAGQFTVGFAMRAPLTDLLSLEGNGSYMRARNTSGPLMSRNYSASVSVGITYAFSLGCLANQNPYLPVANHANFLVDTNINN